MDHLRNILNKYERFHVIQENLLEKKQQFIKL